MHSTCVSRDDESIVPSGMPSCRRSCSYDDTSDDTVTSLPAMHIYQWNSNELMEMNNVKAYVMHLLVVSIACLMMYIVDQYEVHPTIHI
jgi:hypothetical protein